MKSPRVSLALVVAVAMAALPVAPALGTAAISAQSDGRYLVTPGRPSVAVVRIGSIVGTAWMHDNTPIAHGLLRLRNIVTGRIMMGTQSDAMGRFDFDKVPPGSYVVELVNQEGSVRAVSQMFSVAPGETIATFIRLGARGTWIDGFFSNAAAAALSAAAALGVTAVGDGVTPASARF
jgi:hypothetical protein